VYDSGVGGVSVLRELRTVLPAEDLLYAADTAWCPYGGRPAEQIVERAVAVTDFLLEQGVKLIVVACNTATIAAVGALRAQYPVAFVGMEPAVKPAAARTRSGVVGVLATGASLAGDRFQGLVARHARGVEVVTQPCHGLVERIEAGDVDGPVTTALVERYVRPLLDAGADTIVLGCTHYPFVRPLIAAAAGPDVALVDTGRAVARRTRDVLTGEGLLRREDRSGTETWASSDAERAAPVLAALWGTDVVVEPMHAPPRRPSSAGPQ
jgi:glutamate racemase